MPTPAQTDPTAVFGRRVLAVVIDWLVIVVPSFLFATTEFEYVQNPPSRFCDDFMDQVDGVCIQLGDRAYFTEGIVVMPSILAFALAIGILVVLQGLTGTTPGKLLTGIRTVKADGSPPGIGKAFVRWLLLIVDSLPCLYLVGIITALTSTGHRRVGDMVAKTFVVRSRAAGSPIVVPGLTAPQAAPAPAYAGAGYGPPRAPGPDAEPGREPAAAAPEPQWDEARGTYIQWDPAQQRWLQWDDTAKAWTPIPGQ